jgi:hypothetical protein
MSPRVDRTSIPMSVYLSPRATAVLRKYFENSGFGSMSRTVEELILAYDKIYTTFLSSISAGSIKDFFANPQMIFLTFLMMMNNLNLNDGSPYEQVLRKEIEEMIRSRAGK